MFSNARPCASAKLPLAALPDFVKALVCTVKRPAFGFDPLAWIVSEMLVPLEISLEYTDGVAQVTSDDCAVLIVVWTERVIGIWVPVVSLISCQVNLQVQVLSPVSQ